MQTSRVTPTNPFVEFTKDVNPSITHPLPSNGTHRATSPTPAMADHRAQIASNRSDLYQQSNLTMNQLQIWLGQSLVPETPIFNLAAALSICGAIQLEHFQKAFQVLVNSSDALRTVVEQTEGVPVQRVLAELKYELDIVDLSNSCEPRNAAKSWMEERCQLAFNWRKRLFDSALIKLSAREYVWYLNIHHIICDGWSFELIYRHLSDLYNQSLEGTLPHAIAIARFADYVEHEREYRESPRHQKAGAYWNQKLRQDVAPLSFYGKVPQAVTTVTRRIRSDLGQELTSKLKSVLTDPLWHGEGASLLHVFAAVVVAYLHCLNAKSSYAIGIPFHNRRSKLFKDTIGFFSEILPVRIDVAEDDTFTSLISRTKREILKALRHGQHSVINSYRKKNYEVVVNYHTRSFCEFAGMPASPKWVYNGHGDDSLALQVHDFGASDGLALDLDLHQSLFNEEEGKQALRHVLRVLESFATNPDQPLRQVSLLSPEEATDILREWNHKGVGHRDQRAVHALFEEQAALSPDDIAVVLEEKQLTYRELNQRSNKLARYLQQRGVAPGTLVGLYLERSPEMVVGLLGILKAGGAYVPLDPKYSYSWLKFVLEETRAPVLLTQRNLSALLPQDGPELICLDHESEAIDQQSDENLGLAIAGDHLAYVIYTSGSTGIPKGVEIPHSALVNFTVHAGQFFGMIPSDRVLQFASLSFDTAAEEIFPCLSRGATLVLRTDSMLDSVSEFLERCREWRITVLDLPTAYWHELTSRLSAESLFMPEQSRLVIIGGERAIPERLAQWQACVGNRIRLCNTYGPTETTVAATMGEVTDTRQASEVLIGRPIPNVQVYVLDQNLKPVPAGVPGELHIAGAGLAHGYLNRPELTAEKFISNPFGEERTSRLYKTGDLVRFRSDGNLEFIGRMDHQVKVLGFRVELEGVEAVLRKHPLIKEAVVAQDISSTHHPLFACVVPKEGAVLNSDDLRSFLQRQLPAYMIPAAFMMLDSLPLKSNGKIDRQALSLLRNSQYTSSKPYVPPQTSTERQIANIWCEVLGLEQVGRDDHFFELGGHSLLAAQITSRMRKEFEIDIPLRAIFETPTIEGLAVCVEELKHFDQNPSEIVSIPEPTNQDKLPLSFSQTRIWFMDQIAPESAAYNIAATMRFTGRLHKEALKRALDELVRRHESLRTTFRNSGNEVLQVVAPELVLEIPEIDLRAVPEGLRPEEAKRAVRQEASRPFNLEQGPLMRGLLIQLEDADHVLMLNIHHAVCDQWSMGVIAAEMTSLYNAFRDASRPQLAPPRAQYSDFAAWQNEWLTAERWETQLTYWKKQLANFQPLELPTDRPRPIVQTFHGAHDSVSLSKELMEGLKKLSVQENVTLYMTFLAAFKTLLLRYSGQEDIAIGSPIANRNRIEWEGVIGTFVNMLLLRTNLAGSPTFREALGRVRQVALDAFAHQEMPFQKLVEELRPARDPSRLPLVQVLFNFHHLPKEKFDLADLSWIPFEIDQWASQFDISVTVDPLFTRKIWVTYNTDLYDAATIKQLLSHYQRLLEEIIRNPDQVIGKIPILAAAERRELLLEWNNTQEAYPQSCVQELFEAQAERTPDAVAIVFEDKQLTYRELNRRANRLAHHLRQFGVGPEVKVGICVERSLELLVGLLGILKAGGAYVPIDPTYPAERIAFMIEDSSMHLLLTQNGVFKNLPKNDRRILPLESLSKVTRLEHEQNPVSFSRPQTLAYLIYTSGSTGRPKGVQIEHQALINFLHTMRQKPGMSGQDTLLSVTTVSFDIAALELFLPLIVGARVVLVDREVALDGRRLSEELWKSQATVMQATPATWRMLLEAGWQKPPGFKILCGGEALPADLAKALTQGSGDVWNLYGPTETTVWSTVWRVDPTYDRISIGRPIANTQTYVLDNHLAPVPIGVAGELFIGGDGLARGYLNRPDLTSEGFVSNPFSENPKARLYKTGDVARCLRDGNIELLGRKDDQVKIRGFRVELGEIEMVLREYPAISKAVVIAREELGPDKRLVAYVVCHEKAAPTANELRTFLRTKVPDFMLPSAFVFLDRLPLTPNGKVDRQALPAPDQTRPELETLLVVPRNGLELQLMRMWENLLGTRPIGVADNFFDLGGHSLLAVRLMSQIEKTFGKKVPLSALFQAPTIEQMASLIGQDVPPTPWSSLVPLQPNGSKPPFFLIHGELSDALLPRYLGPDQPLYGLRHQSEDGKPALCTTVEDIAAHYLGEIRTVQPQGPYFLGGYCFGGLVAFEMAKRLKEQAQEVALLVMLEPTWINNCRLPTPFPPPSPGLSTNSESFGEKVERHFRQLVTLNSRQKLTYVLDKARGNISEATTNIMGSVEKIAKKVACKVYFRLGYPLPRPLQIAYILEVYSQAIRNHMLRPYQGPITLFLTKEPLNDPSLNWHVLTSEPLEVHEIPGNHTDILKEPHLRVWAEQLKINLERAQAIIRCARSKETIVSVGSSAIAHHH